MPASSPDIVRVPDRIRSQLEDLDRKDDSDKYDEFSWFAREYPRCYRHHLDCAEHRLRSVHSLFCEIHAELARKILGNPTLFAVGITDRRVQRIYWDFESFLSEINIALDLLARVAGTAYPQQMPISFNRFCKKDGDS
jgi:hypothetical protein